MLGSDGLKHILYPLMAIVFSAVIGYAIYYNLRMRRREKELAGRSGHLEGTQQAIRLEKQADEQERKK